MNIEQVVYGTKDNETYLTLILKKNETLQAKDFEKRPAIYKIYGKEEELIYVGETTNLCKRMSTHFAKTKTTSKRFSREDMSFIEYAYVDLDRYSRSIVEGILVAKYRPVFNCSDEAVLEAKTNFPIPFLMDVQFYLRNTDIKDAIIASALGTNRNTIQLIRKSSIGGTLEIPADFVPSVIITDEFIKNYKGKRARVSKELFFKIREEFEKGGTQAGVARKFGLDDRTVHNIYHLKNAEHEAWEQERVKEVA
jgi:hypothetical protein